MPHVRGNPLCLPLFKGENADSLLGTQLMVGFLPLKGGGQVGVLRTRGSVHPIGLSQAPQAQ